MKRASYRLLLCGSLLLLLAACADQVATVVAPRSNSAPVAVDLGGSSRIARIAGSAAEGEGYGTVQASPAAHASMTGMAHETAAAASKPSTPAVDHSKMDHSAMGHGPTPTMSQSTAAGPQIAQASQVQGTGTINAIDAAGHKINLNHNAIPAIGWPAMTMDFTVAPAVNLSALKPGTRVNFTMQRGGDGMYVIQSITPAGGGQ